MPRLSARFGVGRVADPVGLSERLGGEVAEAAMQSNTVVIHAPLLQAAACFFDADEQVLVEAFVTTLAVEAFHKCVLHRHARPAEAQLHVTTVCPCIDRPTAELRTVVAQDRFRCAALLDKSIEDLHDVPAGQAAPRLGSQTSRLKSSTTLSSRKRRPSARAYFVERLLSRKRTAGVGRVTTVADRPIPVL